MLIVALLFQRNVNIQFSERQAHHVLELIWVGAHLLLGSLTRKSGAFLLAEHLPFGTIVRTQHTNHITFGSLFLVVSQLTGELQVLEVHLHGFPVELHESIFTFNILACHRIAVNHLLLVTVRQLALVGFHAQERRSLTGDDSIGYEMSRQVEISVG